MARSACVIIDLSAVQTPVELHHLLMEKLDFPGWYGCNWNAFWDAITVLVAMPEILQFKGWAGFELRLPGGGNAYE
jgi:RNAse (barnase) inhibitor barstar